MSVVRLAINGAAGRMGQRLIALGSADKSLKIAAALEHDKHTGLGTDAGTRAGVGAIGVPLTSSLSVPVDAMIDFSTPAGDDAALHTCLAQHIPLVLATTGLELADKAELQHIATKIPLLWSPSMSLAVNLVMKLTQMAAEALKDHPGGADVEIIERHHRFKEDAPSGTALKFGDIVAKAMGQTATSHGRHGRTGLRRTARSAITPCVSATIRANTQSFSDCWAKASSSTSKPPIAIAMRSGRSAPPGFSPASLPASTA